VSKATKSQELCRAVGMSFLHVVFESQDLAGQQFLDHCDNLIVQRADEIWAPVAPLKTFWSERLSLTLQHIVARAINIRMPTIYKGPPDPTAVDDCAWPGVVGGRVQAFAGVRRGARGVADIR